MTDLWLSVDEAADYLGGVSRRTVYRLVERKKLTMVKVAGASRFRRSELDRYLRASERGRAAYANPAMTARVYSHVSPESQIAALAVLDEAVAER